MASNRFCTPAALVLALAAASAAPAALAASCNGTATVTVALSYTWTAANETAAAAYPSNAHFSGVVCASSKTPAVFVRDATATPGFVLIAETGDTSLLVQELEANPGVTEVVSAPPTDVGTSVDVRTLSVPVSGNSSYVGCVAMIAPSPDWVVGLPDMNVCDKATGAFATSFSKLLTPYDAGSDSGTTYTAGDSATSPQGVVGLATEGVLENYGFLTLTSEAGAATGGSGSAAPDAEDEAECFPAHAEVLLRDGSRREMRHVSVGDEVLSGNGEYSQVFGFTHRDAGARSEFVRVDVAGGDSLLLTPGHYVPVLQRGLESAKNLKAGDVLTLASGEMAAVSEVSRETHSGLYNPQTVSGDIVVNGVLASTYTTAVEPEIAHALLRPVAAAYRAFGIGLTWMNSGADSVLPSLIL